MRGYSYSDRRQWITDAHRIKEQFSTVSKDELVTAYTSNLSAASYRVWLILLHKVSGRTPAMMERQARAGRAAEFFLTLTEIQNLTGLSRASIFRAQKQLVGAGLIGTQKVGKRVYAWLAIPRPTESEMTPANCGKLPMENFLQSQFCDLSDRAQNEDLSSDPTVDPSVSIMRQDPIPESITINYPLPHDELSPVDNGKEGRAVGADTVRLSASNSALRPTRKKAPKRLVEIIGGYVFAKEDHEESTAYEARIADVVHAWKEEPDRLVEDLRRPIPLRHGGTTTRLKLMGWHGTHRRRDILHAALSAIDFVLSPVEP